MATILKIRLHGFVDFKLNLYRTFLHQIYNTKHHWVVRCYAYHCCYGWT